MIGKKTTKTKALDIMAGQAEKGGRNLPATAATGIESSRLNLGLGSSIAASILLNAGLGAADLGVAHLLAVLTLDARV